MNRPETEIGSSVEPVNSSPRSDASGWGNQNDRPDDIYLELDAEGLAAQADVAWIDEEHNKGSFTAYLGEYIAVVGKQLLGHHKSLKVLRNQVSLATGHSPSRIVTTFIERPEY